MKAEIIWSQIYERGIEHLIFDSDNISITPDSIAIGTINNISYRIKYFILLDRDLNTNRMDCYE
jgi:hypothetical protein